MLLSSLFIRLVLTGKEDAKKKSGAYPFISFQNIFGFPL
jgi:hypothetical protein